ncbi:MAG: hypothetical protein O6950_08250 [Gammaproteobacteria bacterium]|nr:hypothetical protein [Gammaproteobacteria bacterium]
MAPDNTHCPVPAQYDHPAPAAAMLVGRPGISSKAVPGGVFVDISAISVYGDSCACDRA